MSVGKEFGIKIYEPCFICGEEALTKKGVIYVRAEIKDRASGKMKWGNHIVCLPCYKIRYRPERDAEEPPKNGLDYTNQDFKKDCTALKKLGLVLEKPEHDFHLTNKGMDVARLIALHKDISKFSKLSSMQRRILEGLYVGD